MTENKRFTLEEINCFDYGIKVMDIIKDNGIELPQSTACDLLNQLSDENKHFKQRNDRQAKRLDELYSLIEREDWQTLKGIIQEFQECEEQLQKEWKCYCE